MVRRRLVQRALVATMTALTLSIASGCAGDSVEFLSGRTLVIVGGPGDALAPYSERKPACVVVDKLDDWVLTRGLLFNDHFPAEEVRWIKHFFEGVDFNEEFAVLVLRGRVDPSSRVTVNRAEQKGDTISVYSTFEDQVPGGLPYGGTGMVGSSYHLMAFKRPEAITNPVTFKFYVKTLSIVWLTHEPLSLTPYKLVRTQKLDLGGP